MADKVKNQSRLHSHFGHLFHRIQKKLISLITSFRSQMSDVLKLLSLSMVLQIENLSLLLYINLMVWILQVWSRRFPRPSIVANLWTFFSLDENVRSATFLRVTPVFYSKWPDLFISDLNFSQSDPTFLFVTWFFLRVIRPF